MKHPTDYTHEEWTSWYTRAQLHVSVAPRLAEELRSSDEVITRSLFATAAATLVELDDDIIVGEFLAHMMRSAAESTTVNAIVNEMSLVAQNLLQAIVDAHAGMGPDQY
jgi:hypothetical protein